MGCRQVLTLSAVLCAACGDVKSGHLADAPPGGDAGIDAIARGTVRVTVLDPSGTGAPAVGANVVFFDPDGTLVKRVATDTAGKAEADVLPGANVTSVVLQNTRYELQTVLAIKPGDDLVLGQKNLDSTSAGNFTVSFPAQPNAASYTVIGPCGSVSVPQPAAGGPPPAASLPITNSCKLDTMEIAVVASDANAQPLAVLSQAGIAFAPGSATLSAAYQPPASFTGSYTNIHPIVTALTMRRDVPDGYGLVSSMAMSPPAATQPLSLTGGARATTALIESQATNGSRATQVVRQSISGTATTYGLDVGATLMPWLNTPTFDAASGKIRVSVDTTGTSTDHPDFVRLTANYSRTDVNQVTTSFTWTLFAPDATDVTLPVLPAEVGNVMPTATDSVRVLAAFLEADTVPGYDAVRNDLSRALLMYSGSRAPAKTVRFGISSLR